MSLTRKETSSGIFFLDVERDTKLAREFDETGSHQGEDVRMLSQFVTPEKAIIDVGAHIGTISIPLSRLAKKVYAFEPNGSSFGMLERNIAENKATNIVARRCALGASEREGHVAEAKHLGGSTISTGGSGDRIEIHTLDTLVTEPVSLIKIDVEGMEIEVLEGARRIIAESRPVVFFEVNLRGLRHHKTGRRTLDRFFKQKAYRLFKRTPTGIAEIFSTSQGNFFDCLAVPKEKVTFEHTRAFPFFMRQIGKKFLSFLRKS